LISVPVGHASRCGRQPILDLGSRRDAGFFIAADLSRTADQVVAFRQNCQIYFINSIVRSSFWGEDVFIADIGNQ
jgi:hypothetical protein